MSGVYISYPFCSQKCTYCNFASGVFPRELEREYMNAVEAEIRAHDWQWTPGTVYLGGGTPSHMALDALGGLMSLIPDRPWMEATMEAAPGSFDEAHAIAWRRNGVNRVSLGVQSFAAKELARTGRKHRAQTVAADVEMLRRCGFEHINIDLITGLPGQTWDTWAESLAWIERLAPDHVSVYMLEVDEDSRLGLEILSGGGRYGAADTPGDELIVELYETAVDRLGAIGLERYEVSNFARPGCESAHNLKYWRREPYVGFGADAHSFDGESRIQNVETATEYVQRWRTGESPVLQSAPANPVEERFFVGLRLMSGILPKPEDWVRFEQPISRFIRDGLLERDGDHLRLTRRGVLLSNEVFADFITT
jgi:oxygen-independent coproporphyrinogen-3 oxidase